MSRTQNGWPLFHDAMSKRCLVEGCTEIITREEAYYYRNSLCRTHLSPPHSNADGATQPFSQQCATFQPVSEFAGGKRYRDAYMRCDSGEGSSHRLGSPTSESTASAPTSAAEDVAGTVGNRVWLHEALHRTGSVMSAQGPLTYVATGASRSRSMPPEAVPAFPWMSTWGEGVAPQGGVTFPGVMGLVRETALEGNVFGEQSETAGVAVLTSIRTGVPSAVLTSGAPPVTPVRRGLSPIMEVAARAVERTPVTTQVPAAMFSGSAQSNKLGHVPLEGGNAGGSVSISRVVCGSEADADKMRKAMVFSSLTHPVPARVVTTGTPSRYERTTETPLPMKSHSHRRRVIQMPPPESPQANYIASNTARLPDTPLPDSTQPMRDVPQHIPTAAAQIPPVRTPSGLSPAFFPEGHMRIPQSPGEPWIYPSPVYEYGLVRHHAA